MRHDPDIIETRRLILRRFGTADTAALHGIMSDPEVMQYWSTLPHSGIAQTQDWIVRTVDAVAAGEGDDFAVTLDGALVGKAGLWKGNEIGMLFAKSVWGAGIAREAVEAIIERARSRSVKSIVADVDPRNLRSVKFLQRLGFAITGEAKGTYHIGDHWTDSIYLELNLAGPP